MGTHPIFESDFDCLTEQISPFSINGRKLEARVTPEEQADADRLCQGFYADLGVSKDDVTNEQIAGGGQGYVFRCATTEDVEPSVTAMKYYYTVEDKNMTELELVNTALNDAGVRPTLYKWLPERGYIEQWLGDYSDLWSSELTMYDLRHQVAAELAKMHSMEIPGLNKLKYTEPLKANGQLNWMWNTRLGRFHFITNLEILSPPNQVQQVLDWYGFNYADYQLNKDWAVGLIQTYYNWTERPVIWFATPSLGL